MNFLQNSDLAPSDVMIFIVCALLGLGMIITVALMGAHKSKMRMKRVMAVTGKADIRTKNTVNVRRATADSSIAAFDYLIKRFLPNPQRMRMRLWRTGRTITLGQYLLFCFALAAILGLALKFVIGLPTIVCVLAGFALGFLIPHIAIGTMVGRRQDKFMRTFPEAIDLIVRGLKSGLPVTESIRVVGQEIADPIGVEFRGIADAVKFGKPMIDALWAIEPRIDIQEFRFFITALAIQQETGGNLAETLENLSTVLRRRKQMKLKIRALSSEAKASAYIIGSLPFIMFAIILTMNYDYGSQLYKDIRGILMMCGGFVSYAIGIAIMWKMVRFEI
jgi:tight adherence protein B